LGSEQKDVGIVLVHGDTYIQTYLTETIAYVIENTLTQPAVILIERPIRVGYDMIDSPAPVLETASERRWKATIPAKTRERFTVKERKMLHSSARLTSLPPWRLAEYLEQHFLDQELFNTLKPIVERYEAIRNARTERQNLEKERETIAARQEQIRANLGALQPVGDEAALRGRVLKQLEASEDRLAEIQMLESELNKMIVITEAEVAALIEALP